MSHSENTSLVLVTRCTNCDKNIELTVLVSEETGEEFTEWRHIISGLYGCYLSGRGLMADNNRAMPDWSVPL